MAVTVGLRGYLKQIMHSLHFIYAIAISADSRTISQTSISRNANGNQTLM